MDAGELEALEWAAELDRREAWAELPDHIRAEAANVQAWAEWRANDYADRERGPGLVSVPTSDTPRSRVPRTPFRVAAQVEALRQSLGAFVPDPVRTRLSRMRRAVGFAARSHIGEAPDLGRCAMLTLTYRPGVEWSPRHVSELLKCIREHLRRRGREMRYVWVAEIQPGRGVLHYHVALWLPEGDKLPYPDRQGWWPHGSTRIEWARAAVPYLLKYLSKGDDVAAFPKGCRTYGCGGQSHEMKRARRWLGLPRFVQQRSDIHDDWRRAPGGAVVAADGTVQGCSGGWRDPAGKVWASEFRQELVGGERAMVRVCKHEDTGFAPDGPFSWVRSAAGEGSERSSVRGRP